MVQSGEQGSNPFSVVSDEGDEESSLSISWTDAYEAVKDFPQERRDLEKKIMGFPHALRRVPKSLKRSAQRVRRNLQLPGQDCPTAMLCSTCEPIFDRDVEAEWFGQWHDHHESRSALDEAVRMGCSICTLVKRNLVAHSLMKDSEKLDYGGPDAYLDLEYRVSLRKSGRKSFAVKGKSSAMVLTQFILDLSLVKAEDFDFALLRPVIAPTTASNEVWDMCRYWLHTCRTQHKACGYLRNESDFRPSRLVRVEGTSGGKIQVRLDCKCGGDRSMDYLTLSHCWGNLNLLTLRKNNLVRFQQEIVFEDMPKVYQDAMVTTLRLGFKYIWIDSLCIIQDSETDWLQESSRMDEIYKHATCNIAATGFHDGRRGFFVDRDIDSLVCQKMDIEWKGNWPNTNERASGHYCLVDYDIWKAQVTEAPLNKRGWVLQERLLSPCVLHFGQRQVLWECFKSYSCETLPLKFPSVVPGPMGFKSLSFYADRADQTQPSQALKKGGKLLVGLVAPNGHNDDLYNTWHRIVERYSESELTRPDDKLLAISGAAKQVRDIINDRYLVGLWEYNFVHDLLWIVDDHFGIGLTSEYRAPTWSWASMNSRIEYDYAYQKLEYPETIHARLIDARITYVTQDDTGLVTHGFIHMQGQLLEAQLLSVGSAWLRGSQLVVNGTKISLRVHLDFYSEFSMPEEQSVVSLKQEKDGTFEVRMSERSAEHYLSSKPLYLLPVRTGARIQGYSGELFTSGLVLVRTEGDEGEYIRIGLFATEEEAAREVILTPSLGLASDLWESDSQDGRYVITII